MHWKVIALSTLLLGVGLTASAHGQGAENPDFRIRAKLRPLESGWAAGESVGGADFRIHSRFMQVYYGGVHRQDEFKFKVSFDYTDVSGFDENYPGSVYDTDYDAYINDGFVGRVYMNTQDLGVGEMVYDSRHATPPDLPLPENFPDPVDIGDVVRVYAAGSSLPEIGDPLPSGQPLFESAFEEEFARGDVNQDGKVDEEDFVYLEANWDPLDQSGPHIGPANGDFDGDNRCDMADYDVFVLNWTDSHDPPAPPEFTSSVEGAEAFGRIEAVFPNPLRGTSEVRLYAPSAGLVQLGVYSVSGAKVSAKILRANGAGWVAVPFEGVSDNGAPLPSGVYLYRAAMGHDVASGSFTVLR